MTNVALLGHCVATLLQQRGDGDAMATTFLRGIALENFRAIGSRTYIGPFRDLNFFIGPNNAGKSTVLLFLANYLHPRDKRGAGLWSRSFNQADARLGKGVSEIRFAFGIEGDLFIQKVLALSESVANRYSSYVKRLRDALLIEGMIWLEPGSAGQAPKLVCDDRALKALSDSEWHALWNAATSRNGGGIVHWTSETLQRAAQAIWNSNPDVFLIRAWISGRPHGSGMVVCEETPWPARLVLH